MTPQQESNPVSSGHVPALGRRHWVGVLRAGAVLAIAVCAAGAIVGHSKGTTARPDYHIMVSERAAAAQEAKQGSPPSLEPFGQFAWLGYLLHNLRVAGRSLLLGSVSLGLLAMRSAYGTALTAAYAVWTVAELAAEATGAAPWHVAVGLLLPHGVPELLAMLLAWALGIRLGLVWLWPLQGLSRFGSFKQLLKWSCVSLLAIVPLLLLAGLLEQHVSPLLADRYILRLDRTGTLEGEQRWGSLCGSSGSALAPDGRRISFKNEHSTEVWLASTHPPGPASRLVRARAGFKFSPPSWSPDASQIALASHSREMGASEGSRVVVAEVKSGETHAIESGPPGIYLGVDWSPEGQLLAVLVGDPQSKAVDIWLHDLDAGRWRQLTQFGVGEKADPSGLSWAPDGGEIAFVRASKVEASERSRPAGRYGREWTICTITPDGSTVREVTEVNSYTPLSWSPDGAWIAFVAADANGSRSFGDLSLVSADGKRRIGNLARADALSSISWSPDGQRLAYHRLLTCLTGELTPVASDLEMAGATLPTPPAAAFSNAGRGSTGPSLVVSSNRTP